MVWKNTYIYILLIAAAFISLIFFGDEKILLPKWGTLFGILFLAYAAADQSWEAWKRKSSLILTDLGIKKGGGTGFQTTGDIRIAKSHKGKPAFAVIATGGFTYAGFAMNGNENFIVCPPEHVMTFSGNFLVKTHLRNVIFRELPSYIQDELQKLPRFKKEVVERKNNLWFGMTSTYYGSDTPEALKIEQTFLDSMSMTREYKVMLDDLLDKKSRLDRFKTAKGDSKYKVVESWKDEE